MAIARRPDQPRRRFRRPDRLARAIPSRTLRQVDQHLRDLRPEKLPEMLRVVDHWENTGVFPPEDCHWIRTRAVGWARFNGMGTRGSRTH